MQYACSIIAGVLYIAGFVPYIRGILRKETQPAKASWVIWTTLDTITIAGMFAKGTVNGQIIATVLGAYTIVVLALKYGKPGWSQLDKFALGGAVLGIALWAITKDPVAAIVTSCAVIFVGSIPTFVSAWEDPSRENRTAWVLFTISCGFAIVAIPAWTLADALQPVTFTIIEVIMIAILFGRPSKGAHS